MSWRPDRRTWLFRVGAVALGLLPLLVIEVVLALVGQGHVDQHVDPFVGFDGQRPLFVLSESGDRYEIARGRLLCFRPDSFQVHKAENEFRVFCLGGSTVQGRPYAIETSFTKWLELSLQAADRNRLFKVVNCGGISYASYRLVPILEEILNHQPDLIVLYTGHNEFLEDRTYQAVKHRPRVTQILLRQMTKLRSFNLLASTYADLQTHPSASPKRAPLPEEVAARLDEPGGLELYHRDPRWRASVVEHFEFNIRRMIALCESAGAPIWIADPVCNLRNSPPFKSEHRGDLTDDQLATVRQLRNEASRLYRSNISRAVRLIEQASAIDDLHAGMAYDLGNCYESMGRIDEARDAYRRAKELDVCPLRMIEPLRQAIRRAARDTQSPLIDVNALFQKQCRNGIPGGYLLVDHVHPSIIGHQMIAELMMNRAVEEGIVSVDPSWTQRRDRDYAKQTETLDDFYYLEAERRLEGLRKWAAGRASQ